MKSGHYSSPFFTVFRFLFILRSLPLWSLAWTHQQSSLRLSQSSSFMRGPEASQSLGCGFMLENGLCCSLVVPPWQRSLTLILSLTVIRVAGSQLGVHLQVPLTLGRKGVMGMAFLMCYSSQLHHHHLYLWCRLVYFQNS